jgi:hypothetical protein
LDFLNDIKKIIRPDKTKKHVKVDLVFVILFGILTWRVSSNLFTSTGFIPFLWNDIHFWISNILWNIMALFGLAWLFRIYVKSLKVIHPIAEDILREISNKVPGAKSSQAYKELCRKYSVKE